jgi:hypothetical protein
MSSTYIIIDWIGNRVNSPIEYATFEDAREAIDSLAEIEADNNFKRGTAEWEELYTGVCEDLYAEEATE